MTSWVLEREHHFHETGQVDHLDGGPFVANDGKFTNLEIPEIAGKFPFYSQLKLRTSVLHDIKNMCVYWSSPLQI